MKNEDVRRLFAEITGDKVHVNSVECLEGANRYGVQTDCVVIGFDIIEKLQKAFKIVLIASIGDKVALLVEPLQRPAFSNLIVERPAFSKEKIEKAINACK